MYTNQARPWDKGSIQIKWQRVMQRCLQNNKSTINTIIVWSKKAMRCALNQREFRAQNPCRVTQGTTSTLSVAQVSESVELHVCRSSRRAQAQPHERVTPSTSTWKRIRQLDIQRTLQSKSQHSLQTFPRKPCRSNSRRILRQFKSRLNNCRNSSENRRVFHWMKSSLYIKALRNCLRSESLKTHWCFSLENSQSLSIFKARNCARIQIHRSLLYSNGTTSRTC